MTARPVYRGPLVEISDWIIDDLWRSDPPRVDGNREAVTWWADDLHAVAEELRSEALLAARPGQFDRLNAIAEQLSPGSGGPS